MVLKKIIPHILYPQFDYNCMRENYSEFFLVLRKAKKKESPLPSPYSDLKLWRKCSLEEQSNLTEKVTELLYFCLTVVL